MKIFPTAEQARRGSRNNVAIHSEIRAIEEAILASIADGQLLVEIDSSYMTSGETGLRYKTAWQPNGVELEDARALVDQMIQVTVHFRDLGYSIVRKIRNEEATTFYWEIMW